MPLGICECGCGRSTGIAKGGPRRGQIARFIRGHHARKHPYGWAEEDRGYATPCRIWLGSKDSSGYGTARDPATKRTRSTHIMAWEEVHGPVPEGLELDHLCCQHDCGNVEHLEPVTHRVNMERAAQRKPSSSRHLGVSFNRRLGKWVAYISVNRRYVHLGTFTDENEAARVATAAREAL